MVSTPPENGEDQYTYPGDVFDSGMTHLEIVRMDTPIAMATAESTVLMTHVSLVRAPKQATKATFAPVQMAIPALDAANVRKATSRPIAQTANRAINAHRRAPNHALLSWSNRCLLALIQLIPSQSNAELVFGSYGRVGVGSNFDGRRSTNHPRYTTWSPN